MLYIIFDKILISEKKLSKDLPNVFTHYSRGNRKSKIFDKGLNDPKITYQIIGF